MKRWPMVTLAWLTVAFLLISLCAQEPGAGLNLPHPVTFSIRSLNLLLEPSPASLTAAPAARTSLPDQTRAEPLERLADQPVLRFKRIARPPSWDTRAPPGRLQRPFVHGKAAGQSRQPKVTEPCPDPPEMRVAARPDAEKGGFATAFS